MDSSQSPITEPTIWSPYLDQCLSPLDLSPLTLSRSHSLCSEPTHLSLDSVPCPLLQDYDQRLGASLSTTPNLATWPPSRRDLPPFATDQRLSLPTELLDRRLVLPQEDITYKGMSIAPPELVSGPSNRSWDCLEAHMWRRPTVHQPRTRSIAPKMATLRRQETLVNVPSTTQRQEERRSQLLSESRSYGSEPDGFEIASTCLLPKPCLTTPSNLWRCMPSTMTPVQSPQTPSSSPLSTDPAVAESPVLLTKLPMGKHIVRSPTNGGKVTTEIVPSSSMTSAATSASSTNSSKFWISTPLGWRPREDPVSCAPGTSTLPLQEVPSFCGENAQAKNSSSLSVESTTSSSLLKENLLKRPLSTSESQAIPLLMPSYIRGPYLSRKMSYAGWKKIKLSKKQMKATNLDEFKEVKIFALF